MSQRLSHTEQKESQRESGRPVPGQTVTNCVTLVYHYILPSLRFHTVASDCSGTPLLPGLVEQAIFKAPCSSYRRL